jgi:hypothetical protein
MALVAYCGGSGMWDVRSEDGERAYSVRAGGRDGLRITATTRHGNLVTSTRVLDEIRRAMIKYNRRQQELIAAAKT